MEWIFLAVAGAVLVWFFLLRKKALVDEQQAQAWVRAGAKVIDVRTPEEFAQRQLPGAINLPLARLKEQIATAAPRKDEVLLLHCVAGGRSAMGVRALRNLGYTRAYNLGSYARAQRIVSAGLAPTTGTSGKSPGT